MDCKKIKLIIWDLDDTLWKGTLAEGDAIEFLPGVVDLVKQLAYKGIMSSICSKNDEKEVLKVLIKHKINDFFIFKSINWDSKGPRIKAIIENMNLKEDSVLFIDDNPSNLGEAKAFCPNIMTSSPEAIEILKSQINNIGKDDKDLTRLSDYHVLEKKYNASTHVKSVDTFLRRSKIKVSICYDCNNEIDRILELINRTNQLNYTKKRIDLEQLRKDLDNKDHTNAYVKCRDKYGDYGIVGFFSLDTTQNCLIHFLFSCRTMGMGIESFVYNYLGCPAVDIVQPVTKPLIVGNYDYIKLVDYKDDHKKAHKKDAKIFLRGPCDLDALSFYLGNLNITKELAYVGNHKVSLFQIGHSQVIADSYDYKPLSSPFVENDMYKTELWSTKYDVVILSILTEAQFALYETPEGRRIVYGECYRDAFNQYNIKDFQNGFDGLSKDDFEELKTYKYLGRISVDDSIANYEKIISFLPQETKVILLLGPTNSVPDERNLSIKYCNAELFYKELNDRLCELQKKYPNLYLIKPKISNYKNRFFGFQSATHYPRKTYYKIAKDIDKFTKHSVKASNSREIKRFIGRIRNKIKQYL